MAGESFQWPPLPPCFGEHGALTVKLGASGFSARVSVAPSLAAQRVMSPPHGAPALGVPRRAAVGRDERRFAATVDPGAAVWEQPTLRMTMARKGKREQHVIVSRFLSHDEATGGDEKQVRGAQSAYWCRRRRPANNFANLRRSPRRRSAPVRRSRSIDRRILAGNQSTSACRRSWRPRRSSPERRSVSLPRTTKQASMSDHAARGRKHRWESSRVSRIAWFKTVAAW